MKINSIQNYNLINRYQNTNNKKQNTPQQNPMNYDSNLPTTVQYLSFMGGYSLNLAETVKQLDKLAEHNNHLYPPHIREWLGLILDSGNKAKKTLISAHKEYFENLENCLTLEQIKARFSEFKDVKSAFEVETAKGKDTFISKFQKGESEYFDNDEDLSVQLIKLYWGQGFSLNDLKKYADGTDLYYTMTKLNIPTASRDYGHILKISDPEYNERLTREMTEKRLAALDRKAQELDGEPVYIKRGHLTPEHKKRISEGLIRHYEENPDRIYEMSERQKKFLQENPEKAEIFTRVVKRAWSIFGADNIKKAMSRFFSQNGIQNFDPVVNPATLTKEQINLMRRFWATNEWAKKSFSKNMKFAWKKIREENNTFFTLRSTPTQLTRFIEEKAGMQPGTLKNHTTFNPYTHESFVDEEANEICKRYTNIPGINNVMADTYQLAVLNIVNALKDRPVSKKNKPFNDLLEYSTGIVRSNISKDGNSYRVQYTEEAQRDFVELAAFAAETRSEELINIVNKALDDAFDMSVSFHKEFILK